MNRERNGIDNSTSPDNSNTNSNNPINNNNINNISSLDLLAVLRGAEAFASETELNKLEEKISKFTVITQA